MPSAQVEAAVLVQELPHTNLFGVRYPGAGRKRGVTQHRGHDFDKLANVLSQLEEQHRGYVTTLTAKKKQLSAVSEEIDHEIVQLRMQKEERNAELERFSAGVPLVANAVDWTS